MFKVQSLTYRESLNLVLSPYSMEILYFAILSSISNKPFEELSSMMFGENINFSDVVETIKSFKTTIDYIKSLDNVEFQVNSFIYLAQNYKIKPEYAEFVQNNLNVIVKNVNFEDETLDMLNVIDTDMRFDLGLSNFNYFTFSKQSCLVWSHKQSDQVRSHCD